MYKEWEVQQLKIGEARETYSYQIKNYNTKQRELYAKKQGLEEKIKSTENGAVIYQNEAAALELQYNAVCLTVAY